MDMASPMNNALGRLSRAWRALNKTREPGMEELFTFARSLEARLKEVVPGTEQERLSRSSMPVMTVEHIYGNKTNQKDPQSSRQILGINLVIYSNHYSSHEASGPNRELIYMLAKNHKSTVMTCKASSVGKVITICKTDSTNQVYSHKREEILPEVSFPSLTSISSLSYPEAVEKVKEELLKHAIDFFEDYDRVYKAIRDAKGEAGLLSRIYNFVHAFRQPKAGSLTHG